MRVIIERWRVLYKTLRKIASLTMSVVSSTIRAHDGMHSETERHFALDEIAQPNHGSLLIVRVRNSVRPSHLFDH